MSTTITQKTMRRVYAIWIARMLTAPIFLKLYAIAIMILGMAQYVSFREVFENAPAWDDFGAQFIFARSAFFHTEILTLFLFCISIIVFTLLCKDIFAYIQKRHMRVLS